MFSRIADQLKLWALKRRLAHDSRYEPTYPYLAEDHIFPATPMEQQERELIASYPLGDLRDRRGAYPLAIYDPSRIDRAIQVRRQQGYEAIAMPIWKDPINDYKLRRPR